MTALLQQIGVAFALLAPATDGQTWAGVDAKVDACVTARSIDRGQLAYLVANELEGAAVTSRLRESGAAFEVACDGDRVVARVTGPVAAETSVDPRGLERTVATRTLALAIIEMVTELPEPPVEPPPVIEPPVVEAPPPTKSPPTKPPTVDAPKRSLWILRAGVDAIGFPLAPLGLFGGALDVRHRPSRHVGWLVGVIGSGGRDRATIGVVRAFAASAIAALVVHADRPRIEPFVAIGARGGVASLRGVATGDDVAARRLTGAWVGPVLRGGLDVNRNRLVIGVHVESGWAVQGTRARVNDRLGPGATGLWIGGGLSIGWRFFTR